LRLANKFAVDGEFEVVCFIVFVFEGGDSFDVDRGDSFFKLLLLFRFLRLFWVAFFDGGHFLDFDVRLFLGLMGFLFEWDDFILWRMLLDGLFRGWVLVKLLLEALKELVEIL
jgi:hypothetical protein